MQSLPTCGLAKVQTMAKLWGDRETKLWYALWKEVVINEQWWRRSRQSCFEEASQRCQQGVGQSGITTSSAPSSNLFNLASIPSLWSRGKSSENACAEGKKHEMSKWRPAKKGIGRPITRCHCDFCDLWKRAQHGKHRFPIPKGQKQTD